MGSNYKSTLRLPQCDFAMRANLTHKEPKFLDYWKQIDLWKKLRAQSAGKEKFTLHDGPPYANGHIHIGTAMNKLLKDTINRFQQMSGKDACYVPGWDCHGLPIEWVIEKAMKAQGQNHEDLPITEFRNRCRKFAEQWVSTQSQEFQRLGVCGDWENPYTTMKKASEKRILELLYSFLNDGSLYRSRKIVLWSVVEKTSLADAEVNYANIVSKSAYFLFPVKLLNQQPVDDLAVAVWTTTAWTIPCNQALAYNQQYTYGIYQAETDKLACSKFILADGCAARFTAHTGIKVKRLAAVDPSNLICKHPLHEAGYNDHVSLCQADFVTDATGTGIVHIAPDHGKDDYDVSVAHNFPVEVVVQEDGHYVSNLPLFAGQHIFKVKDQVHQALVAAKMLVGLHDFTHESAISDRSKMPLIYRSTWQWFISMEKSNLQQKTLDQIEQITYHPQVSKNRLRSTLATRPDWLVSRQRRWGVPLAFFLNKKDLQPLRDQEVNARIIAAVAKEGSDTWFTSDSSRFLGEKYAASDFVKVEDIIDIWFEAGATFSFVLEEDERLKFPADLYLEGSDQHRGWFQAALMLACGTRGVSPFKHLFTHGFVLDANGFKMSKSLGNTIAPQTIIDRYGADILRLWAVSIDYHDNMCIGDQLLEQTADCYRKFRNVLRFILGNLRHEGAQNVAQIENLPKLESYVLHKLSLLEMEITGHIQKFEIREITQKLLKFCDLDLSAFYLNIRKDVLYCDAVDSQPRQAANAVLHQLFQRLVRLLAPVLPFTAEEAWLSYHQENATSVHLQQIEAYCPAWQLPQHEIAAWNRLLAWTKLINEALEQARQNHLIRNNRETQVILHSVQKEDLDLHLLAEINMVAEVICEPSTDTDSEARVEVARFAGKECARCRKLVSKTDGQEDLCHRCAAVVRA